MLVNAKLDINVSRSFKSTRIAFFVTLILKKILIILTGKGIKKSI